MCWYSLDYLNQPNLNHCLFPGDHLLATCLQQLGGLRNNEVTELISTGLRDLVEGDFFGDHDAENNPVPTQPKAICDFKGNYDWEHEDNLKKLGSNEFLGQGKDEWILRTMLTSGSILAKGCQGAMKLAKRGDTMEKTAYMLGGHLALLWQLYLDIKDFFVHPNSYSLVGAPVTIALWEYPTIYSQYILESKVEKKPVELKQLYYAVRATRAVEYLTIFLNEELESVMKCTEEFPVEDARLALRKMAATIHSEAIQYMDQ